jgi:hypothetical protein
LLPGFQGRPSNQLVQVEFIYRASFYGGWPDAAPQRCPKHTTERWKNAHASLPPVTSMAKRSLETTLVARFPERIDGHEGHH